MSLALRYSTRDGLDRSFSWRSCENQLISTICVKKVRVNVKCIFRIFRKKELKDFSECLNLTAPCAECLRHLNQILPQSGADQMFPVLLELLDAYHR